jgi:hypothetical protein
MKLFWLQWIATVILLGLAWWALPRDHVICDERIAMPWLRCVEPAE